jgi:hypothetical protein
MSSQMISHDFHGKAVQQRSGDGYFDATAMCKATGKRWNNYYQLPNTQEFLDVLSAETGITVSEQNQGLVQTTKGGNPQNQGTWVHPYVSINLAQWCSPEFAVKVSIWVFELMTAGKVELGKQSSTDALTWQLRLFSKLTEANRIATSSQLMLARAIGESHGIDTSFIPDYTDEPVTKALTTLLKEGDYTQSAITVNKLLVTAGYLEQHTRPSSKNPNKTKKYWVLTDKGLQFGKNLISDKNQKETQPHYFTDSFDELMGLLA